MCQLSNKVNPLFFGIKTNGKLKFQEIFKLRFSEKRFFAAKKSDLSLNVID